MSDSGSAAQITTQKPAAKPDRIGSSPGEAATPGGDAGTARAGTPLRDDSGPAAPALPRRAGGNLLPAMPARTIQPPVSPELLRRVLDGLRQL
jgi:hypothetical protein